MSARVMRRILVDSARARGNEKRGGGVAKVSFDEALLVTEEPGQAENAVVLKLRVAPADLGKVIGRGGRTARALRTLVAAASARGRKRVLVDIVE